MNYGEFIRLAVMSSLYFPIGPGDMKNLCSFIRFQVLHVSRVAHALFLFKKMSLCGGHKTWLNAECRLWEFFTMTIDALSLFLNLLQCQKPPEHGRYHCHLLCEVVSNTLPGDERVEVFILHFHYV